MQTKNEEEDSGDRYRKSNSSDVVMVEDRAMAGANTLPPIASLNIKDSSQVHVGPKIVSITQHITTEKVVKELPLRKYIWNFVQNTSKAEKYSCIAALGTLLLCSTLVIYFNTNTEKKDVEDKAPHEWYISREMWLAKSYNESSETTFEPLKIVIVEHSVSPECHAFKTCAAEIRNIQQWFLSDKDYDIPYNFLIGNDGRVYEGRGWRKVGAHTRGYNLCSIGIGFIGDYREEFNVHTKVTQTQILRTHMLLEQGVKLGHLDRDYVIVGAKDLKASESPGSNLYNAIKKWDHYDHKNRYTNKTCIEIHANKTNN